MEMIMSKRMSKFSHQFGPWYLDEERTAVYHADSEHFVAALPDDASGEWGVEDHANARLILAAPELLERLMVALKRLEEKSDNSNRDIGLIVAIKSVLDYVGVKRE
jgi:hypothetical protein